MRVKLFHLFKLRNFYGVYHRTNIVHDKVFLEILSLNFSKLKLGNILYHRKCYSLINNVINTIDQYK